MSVHSVCLSLGITLVVGCGKKDVEDQESDTSDWESSSSMPEESVETEDTGPLDAGDMPANPGPFTVSLSDGTTLEFDMPSCTHYRGSTNFRAFWRKADDSHVYVMILEVMRSFDGVGVYSSNEGSVAVKLQEEAGGSSGGVYTTTELADEVVMSLDYLDEDRAWGEMSVGSLWNLSQSESVTVSPSTIPVWCNDLAI